MKHNVLIGALLLASCECRGQNTQPSPGMPGSNRLQEARAQLEANEPANAEILVRQLLVREPNSAEAHSLLGFILFREIQADAVTRAGSATHAASPASLALRDRNARASLAEYMIGSQLSPPTAFDLKIVAMDYILLDDYPNADRWLTKSLRSQPNDMQAWYYLGRTKFKEADYSGAIDAFHHVLAVSPHDIPAQDNLGLAYAGLGQMSAAIEALRTALTWAEAKHATNDAPWVDIGDTLTQAGRAPEAIPYLQKAVALNADDLRAREKLAEAYRRTEEWTKEQVELEKAIQLAPDSAALHFMLGQAYRKNGHLEKARGELAVSAALHSHDATRADQANQ